MTQVFDYIIASIDGENEVVYFNAGNRMWFREPNRVPTYSPESEGYSALEKSRNGLPAGWREPRIVPCDGLSARLSF